VDTDDPAENIARHVALLARSFNQVFADTGRVIVRSEKAGEALVLEKRHDGDEAYYSVTTIRPAKENVWGNPVWVGRLTFPTNELRQPGASTLSDGQEASQPSRIGQRNQTEHFSLTAEPQRKQASVTYRRRRAFTAKESRGPTDFTGHTADEIRDGLIESFGGKAIRQLEANGVLSILENPEAFALIHPDVKVSSGAKAIFVNDRAYLFANRMHPATAKIELLHEIGEHFGLERMLGKKGYSALIERVKELRDAGDEHAKRAWNFVARNYPEETAGSRRFMREVLAQLGQNADIQTRGWWKQMIEAVKRFLVKMGFTGMIKVYAVRFSPDISREEVGGTAVRRVNTGV
jgi:hypothetical protein